MPGPYGRTYFTPARSDASISLRNARSGPCSVCHEVCYRQTYIVGSGWLWRHYSCDPVRPVIERRSRHGTPMGYIPRSYDRLQHAERINNELNAGNLVARAGPDRSPQDSFRMKVH